jgi:RHS repeat-associated protein
MGLPSKWSVRRSDDPLQQIDAASWEHDACDRLVASTRDGRRREYLYDKASHLIEVRCSDVTLGERFELDSSGNRVQAAGARCDYDPTNRLLRHGNREFVYDGLGNQVADRGGQQPSSYTYNGRGQLARTQTRGRVIEYAYDALGRRILKKVNGVTTRYQWAGTQLLSESTDHGTRVVQRDYLFCPEFLTPLAFREGSAIYYVHCGRLQEPLCVTDKAGEVVWKAEYFAFGRAVASIERVRQPWRLPGQYHDEETGLHYAVARYYDPDLGRYLSMDPLRLPGNSLNYYTYCDGDPLNRVDPTGEISLTLGTVLIAVGVGIAVGAAIGAGVELYKERNQETDWSQVGRAAVIGGCLGGIGGAVGVVAEAAVVGTLGVLGAGAAAGGLGAAAEYCVEAAGKGEWDWSQFGTSVAAGAATGAVTAGIGGIIAGRAARRAAQEAAREAEERAAREMAERAAREAEERAAREVEERAAREAEERAAREAADKAAKEATQKRLSELANEGHGPQRHEGDVTDQQLKDRAMYGKDPMTGTTVDGVTGGVHKTGKNATKVNTPEDYVKGEAALKNSNEFKDKAADAAKNGENRIVVEDTKLEDIYGPQYRDSVSGQTRQGSKNNPTGTTPTDFTDGTMKGVYDRDPATGEWKLVTMYPEPK